MNPIFQGSITNGVLYLDDLAAYQKQIASLDGKPVEVILRRHREKRSLPANSYLHGVVIPLMAEHCGYEKSDMKDALKAKFLMDETGPVPRIKHTSELDSKEFAEFTDQCIRLAGELGVSIPEPGQAE